MNRYVCVVLFLSLVGCGRQPASTDSASAGSESAEFVIKQFAADGTAGEFACVWGRLDERSQGKLEMITDLAAGMNGMKDRDNAKKTQKLPPNERFVTVCRENPDLPFVKKFSGWKVQSVQETGDTAETTILWKDYTAKVETETTKKVPLRKIDGAWKVSLETTVLSESDPVPEQAESAEAVIKQFCADGNAGHYDRIWDRLDGKSQGFFSERAHMYAGDYNNQHRDTAKVRRLQTLPDKERFIAVCNDSGLRLGSAPQDSAETFQGWRVESVREMGDTAEAFILKNAGTDKQETRKVAMRKIDRSWKLGDRTIVKVGQ